MNIDQLMIEVTRKCNFHCGHCLRGNAQNKNINPKVIWDFLEYNDIGYISSLTITGGEPLLNPSGINKIVNYILDQKISIGMFYMVTNGSISPIPIMESLGKLHKVVDEEDMFQIMISQDEYHENEGDEHPIWNLIQHGYKEGSDYEHIIAEGRGKELNPKGRKVEINSVWEWDQDDIYEGMVYINALGMICTDCDLSYKTQSYHNLGHCLSKKLKEMK